MPNLSRNFIFDRAQKTCAVAMAIASSWQSVTMPPDVLNTQRSDAEAVLDLVTLAEAGAAGARGALDGALESLYQLVLKGVGLARVKWADDPARLRIISTLEFAAQSRVAMRKSIKDWSGAWEKLDPAWVVQLPHGQSQSLAQYKVLRRIIEGDDLASPKVPGLVDAMEEKVQLARAAAEGLNTTLDALEARMEAWYAEATTLFSTDTPEGAQIRGQIPTTYNPAHEPLPIPPTPSGVAAGPGSEPNTVAGVCLPATYAAEYVWTLTPVAGSPETSQITTNAPSVLFTDVFSLTNGTLSVAARNATGTSASSPPVPVNI